MKLSKDTQLLSIDNNNIKIDNTILRVITQEELDNLLDPNYIDPQIKELLSLIIEMPTTQEEYNRRFNY